MERERETWREKRKVERDIGLGRGEREREGLGERGRGRERLGEGGREKKREVGER